MNGNTNGNGNVAKQEQHIARQYVQAEKSEWFIVDRFMGSEKASEIFGIPFDKHPVFLRLWLQVFVGGYVTVSTQVREVFSNLKNLEYALSRYSTEVDDKTPARVVFDSSCARDRVRGAFLAFLNSVSLLDLLFTGLTESLTVNFERNLEEYIKGSSGDDETVLDVESSGAVHQNFPEYYGKLLKMIRIVSAFNPEKEKPWNYSPFFRIDREDSNVDNPIWLLKDSNPDQVRLLVELCEELVADVDGDKVACLQKYAVPLIMIKVVHGEVAKAEQSKLSLREEQKQVVSQINFSELMLVSARESEEEVRKFFTELLKRRSGSGEAKLSERQKSLGITLPQKSSNPESGMGGDDDGGTLQAASAAS